MSLGFWIAVGLALLAGVLLMWASARGTGSPQAGSRKRGRMGIIVAALMVPVLALGLQLFLNPPETGRERPAAPAGQTQGTGQGESTRIAGGAGGEAGHEMADIERMVEQLDERLRNDPDDGEGWLMLARSNAYLERHQQAAEAYARAHELLGDDPELLTRYAESLILSQQGEATPRVAELVDRALEMNPDNGSALWLSGVAAYQEGEYRRAGEQWQRLLALLPSGSENERMVRDALADVEAQGIDLDGRGGDAAAEGDAR